MAVRTREILAVAFLVCGCSGEDRKEEPIVGNSTATSAGPKASNPLQVMADVAQQICQAPSLVGYRRTLGAEASGSISISKLLGRLAQAGVGVKLKAEQEDWEGLLQEDLGDALESGNTCRQQVFNAMLERFSVTTARKVPEDLFSKLSIGSQIDRAEEILGKPFRVSEEDESWRMYRLLNDNLSVILYYDDQKNIDCVFAEVIGEGVDGIPLYIRSEGKTDIIFGRSRIDFAKLQQTFADCSDDVQTNSYQNVSFAGVFCRAGSSAYKPAFIYAVGTNQNSSASSPAALQASTFNVLAYHEQPEDAGEDEPYGGSCLWNAMDAHAWGQA